MRSHAVIVLLAIMLSGCLPGPNPDRPDSILLKNELDERAEVVVLVRDSRGDELATTAYDIAAGELTRREWKWGKGVFVLEARSSTGNATEDVSLDRVPQTVQITVAAWGLSVATLHGD